MKTKTPKPNADVAEVFRALNFQHAPAAAAEVYSRAMKKRPPLQSFKAKTTTRTTPVVSTKGLSTMPQAVAAPASYSAPVSRMDPPPARTYAAPRHLNGIVRGITGSDAYQRVYAAQMALQAELGKMRNCRCVHAEQYLTRQSLRPLNIANTQEAIHGGYLMPDELAALVIAKMGPVGVARRILSVQPMTSGTMNVPKESSGPTVRYADEGQSVLPSDFVYGSVGFAARKRSVFWKISNELAGDQLFSAVDNFTTRAAYSLSRWQDRELILGDGTSVYGGEVGLLAALGTAGVVTAATGHDLWSELDLDDFGAVMAKPNDDFLNGGESWVCSPQFYYIAMLPAAGGAAQGFAPDGRPLFLGKPVNFTGAMPTSSAAATVCCLFGNFAEAGMLGDRSIVFSLSDQTPGAFENDLTFLLAHSRYDLNIHEGGDDTNAGAYAGLKTAA